MAKLKLNKFYKTKTLKLLIFFLILVLALPNLIGFAQTPTEEREALEEELRQLEEQISEIEKDIDATEQEKKTLQNQIYILRNKIKKLDLQIYQSNVMIDDLGLQIKDTEYSIGQTSLKIDDSRYRLAKILQLVWEADQKSLIEILFSEEELSDFFDDLMALESLNQESQELLENIQNLKIELETEKTALGEERQDLEGLVEVQTLQRQQSAGAKTEKDWLLKLTEAEYQKYLKEKEETEKKAAAIRARIFELIGVPKAPTFGEAYEIAKYVSSITGVRPALLLAVLTQESNIGKNVGQCYLKNPSTGEGVVAYNGQKISRVMNPTRDVPHFLQITQELGRDPYSTPVSCPMSYGWGGAMGPAQFIPDTWRRYKDRISAITGKPADPWNIKDAFLAAGLYLSDYGAAKQTYDSEFNAVLSYFAGPGWYKSRYKNVYKRDYGYPVMSITKRYEEDIKALEQAS
jgi:membrane-bound lytic murein transglycosylase B